MQVSLLISALLLYTKVSSHNVDLESLTSFGNTLELVHVVFRHGDRTPDSLYPNDPYTPETFYPEGIGELTNKGKNTDYNVGKSLRKKYGKFLGDVYTPQVLYCVASHYPRTKASVQLVLAGLYPPAIIQTWNDELLWQPIPCDYMKREENTLFAPFRACPSYSALLQLSMVNSTSDPIYIKHQNLFPYIREMTGYVDTEPFFLAANLYSTLLSEEEYGLALPSWTETVYPDVLVELQKAITKYLTGIGQLKILVPGFMMSRIVNNTYLTINGDASVKGRKLYLYSGHDINVASILHFLGRSEERLIAYGAQIRIEVHKILGIRFFRFLLENYEHQIPETLFVPNCGYLCPVDTFVNLYADVLDPLLLNELCYN